MTKVTFCIAAGISFFFLQGCKSEKPANESETTSAGRAEMEAAMAKLVFGDMIYYPREGDILFQSSPHNPLIDAIEGVTQSAYSHCGVLVKRAGKWFVNEALNTVHDTAFEEWIARGRDGKFSVYRLKDAYEQHLPAFLSALNVYNGRDYDFDFELHNDMNLYCSELVFKAFRDATGIELGALVPLGKMNWKPYEDFIINYQGGPPPLDRIFITPRHLAEAPQLQRIFNLGFGEL